MARRTAERLLRARGRWINADSAHGAGPPEDDAEPFAEQAGLRACYDATARGVSVSGECAGQPTLRLALPPEPQGRIDGDPQQPEAEVRGVTVYAKQRIDGRDRRQLERLRRGLKESEFEITAT